MQQPGAETQQAFQALERVPRLEELLDAAVLGEFLSSCHVLFSMPLRVLSDSGRLVARAGDEPPLHEYLGTSELGSERLGALYARLREVDLLAQPELVVPAFSGARYHVQAIGHQGSRIGRIVLGPFRTVASEEGEGQSLAQELGLDAERIRMQLAALPALSAATLDAIAQHVGAALRLMLFLAHKSLVASHAQLSVAQDLERRLQHQAQQARQERRAHGFQRQEQSGLLLRLSKQLHGAVRRLQARVGSDPVAPSVREAVLDNVSSGLQQSCQEVEQALHDLQSAPLSRMSIAPRDLVGNLREQLEQHAGARAVPLTFSVESELPPLLGDEASLLSAFRALALGMLECTPEGSPLSVAVSSACQDDSMSTGELLFDRSRGRRVQIHMRGGDPSEPRALAGCMRSALDPASTEASLPQSGWSAIPPARSSVAAELSMARQIIERHGGSARFVSTAEPGAGELVIELPSQ